MAPVAAAEAADATAVHIRAASRSATTKTETSRVVAQSQQKNNIQLGLVLATAFDSSQLSWEVSEETTDQKLINQSAAASPLSLTISCRLSVLVTHGIYSVCQSQVQKGDNISLVREATGVCHVEQVTEEKGGWTPSNFVATNS